MYIFNWYIPDPAAKILKVFGIIFMVSVFCFFLFMTRSAVVTIRDYEEAASEYSDVLESYFKSEADVEHSLTEDEAEKLKKEIKDSTFPRNENRDEFPEYAVDYNSLKMANSDTVGWIVCDKLNVNYPIVKTDNNKEYLTKTFEGNINSAGCIFMDYQCASDFTDNNTFIYGHQMKDGSMFGKLKTLIKTPQLLDGPIYIYIYTASGIARYEIVSCYVTNKNSNTYYTSPTKALFSEYTDMIYQKSTFESEIPQEKIDRIITLSTCHGQSGSSSRFVAHAAIIDKYYYDFSSSHTK